MLYSSLLRRAQEVLYTMVIAWYIACMLDVTTCHSPPLPPPSSAREVVMVHEKRMVQTKQGYQDVSP